MSESLQSIMALLGPLLGAGAGSYFGLKGALNGLKERTQRIEQLSNDARDRMRDLQHEVTEMRRELCQ